MSPRQEDLMQVTVQGTKRSDVIRMLKKALAHVEGGGLGMSEHPNSYDPFVSVMAPTGWTHGQEETVRRHMDDVAGVLQELAAITAMFPEPGKVCSETGVVHWQQLKGGPTRDNWARAMKILPSGRRGFEVSRVVLGLPMYQRLLQTWGVEANPAALVTDGVRGVAPPSGSDCVYFVLVSVDGVIPDNTILLYSGSCKDYSVDECARVDFIEEEA